MQMIRNLFLNVRLNADEHSLAAALAQQLERTESDMVRLLLREKARSLGLIPDAIKKDRPVVQAT
jgi:hypothetical protein